MRMLPGDQSLFLLDKVAAEKMLVRCMTRRMATTMGSTSLRPFSAVATEEDDVLFTTIGKKGLITLNKPRQLNALNHSMVNKIYPKLQQWKHDKDLIVVKGNSPKAFCAGGDVVSITKDRSGATARNYFRNEYMNNGLIASLKTPYVALIHGIVMGGGVGISIHGKYRVATETSLFAMPETQIGLFPDVGVSHFLARMPHSLGTFLALTGYRLKGYDLCHTGIATHFCHSELLVNLEAELLEESADVDKILHTFHADSLKKLPSSQAPPFALSDKLSSINSIFSANSVEEIYSRLQQNNDAFSGEMLKLLDVMSPLSLKVTLRQIQVTSSLDVYETLNQDFRLAWWLLAENEFYEGVRALLVDKDKNPKWQPAKLSEITDAHVEKFFRPLSSSDELNLPKALGN